MGVSSQRGPLLSPACSESVHPNEMTSYIDFVKSTFGRRTGSPAQSADGSTSASPVLPQTLDSEAPAAQTPPMASPVQPEPVVQPAEQETVNEATQAQAAATEGALTTEAPLTAEEVHNWLERARGRCTEGWLTLALAQCQMLVTVAETHVRARIAPRGLHTQAGAATHAPAATPATPAAAAPSGAGPSVLPFAAPAAPHPPVGAPPSTEQRITLRKLLRVLLNDGHEVEEGQLVNLVKDRIELSAAQAEGISNSVTMALNTPEFESRIEGHYRLWHLNKVKLLDLDGGSKKANAGAKYRLLQPLPL